MVSMATPLHCGDTKDSSNHEAKLCQGIGFCFFPAGSATAVPCLLPPVCPTFPTGTLKGRGVKHTMGCYWGFMISATRLPFQIPLYIAVYCCIPSKSPTERWGSQSCSSSETKNVMLAVESSPAKQHSLSPEHSISVPGVHLHKAASSAQHSASAEGHSVGVTLCCTAHPHPAFTLETPSCHTAQTHGCSLQLYENCWHQTEVAPAAFGYALQELYFVPPISFLQFTSPSSRPTSSEECTMWLANQTLLLIAVITFLGPIAEPGKLTTVSRVQP